MSQAADWTCGAEAIAYQRCPACAKVWYFRRDFCPNCGRPEPDTLQASGRGRVHAATTVNRAPSPELRQLAPYRIVLVDAVEGFRLMAHGTPGLAIDDEVEARFVRFGELTIPYFEPVSPEQR